jgi:hypothetical protein
MPVRAAIQWAKTEANWKFGTNVLLAWLFGDVVYAVLPIGVIGILTLMISKPPADHLIGSPEWSFAAIICYGLSIRHLIELKILHQKDFSDRLDTGTQVYVLLLIASVLTLTVVKLGPVETLSPVFTVLQMILFLGGMLSLLLVTWRRLRTIDAGQTYPSDLSKKHYVVYLEQHLGIATQSMSFGLCGIRRIGLFWRKDGDAGLDAIYDEQAIRRLLLLLHEVDRASCEIRRTLQTISGENGEDECVEERTADQLAIAKIVAAPA